MAYSFVSRHDLCRVDVSYVQLTRELGDNLANDDYDRRRRLPNIIKKKKKKKIIVIERPTAVAD